MITICGLEIKSLEEAPKAIENSIKMHFRVNSLSTLSLDEKIQAIHKMGVLGMFALRNGVNMASKMLDISRVTIYKYINAQMASR